MKILFRRFGLSCLFRSLPVYNFSFVWPLHFYKYAAYQALSVTISKPTYKESKHRNLELLPGAGSVSGSRRCRAPLGCCTRPSDNCTDTGIRIHVDIGGVCDVCINSRQCPRSHRRRLRPSRHRSVRRSPHHQPRRRLWERSSSTSGGS